MTKKSPLQIARAAYKPKLPQALCGAVKVIEGEPTQSVATQAEIKELFPQTYGLPVLKFDVDSSAKNKVKEPINVGVILSGGQAPGGHNVICGLYDALKATNPTLITIAISACMAGAVCGDHCSPISDTTIMASAGAQCEHVNHVTTQLPYAVTAAAVSFVSYIIAGFVQSAWIALPIAIALMVATMFVIRAVNGVLKEEA